MTFREHSTDLLQLALAAAVVVLISLVPPVSAGANGRAVAGVSKIYSCGSIQARLEDRSQHRFAIRVTHGKVSCDRAKRIMSRFLERDFASLGWTCFRGHGTDRWAAACAAKRPPDRVIRAYVRDTESKVGAHG